MYLCKFLITRKNIKLFYIFVDMIELENYCKTCEKYGLFKKELSVTVYYTLRRDAQNFVCKRNADGKVFVALGTDILDNMEFVTREDAYILEAKSVAEMEEFIELALRRYKRIMAENRHSQLKMDFI